MPDLRHAIRRRIITVANPAAGAELDIPVPGSEEWVIESLAFRFVADANVANRVIALRAVQNAVAHFWTVPNASQAAGSTLDYTAFSGVGASTTSATLATILWPANGLVLRPGQRLQSLTANIQVGDQFSAIRLQAVVFPTGPSIIPVPNVSALIESTDGAIPTPIPYWYPQR